MGKVLFLGKIGFSFSLEQEQQLNGNNFTQAFKEQMIRPTEKKRANSSVSNKRSRYIRPKKFQTKVKPKKSKKIKSSKTYIENPVLVEVLKRERKNKINSLLKK